MANGITSQRGLARLHGCSATAIGNAFVHRGLPAQFRERPTPAKPWSKDKADAFQAWRAETLSHDPAAPLRKSGGNGQTQPIDNRLVEESIRLKRSRADMAEIEVRVRRGELVDRAELERQFMRKIRFVKRHLQDRKRRTTPRLMALVRAAFSGSMCSDEDIDRITDADIDETLKIFAGKA